MANLKLTSTEEISVSGKRVSNSKSHNISGITNVYQETIKLNKRPASYMYLHVAEVPAADDTNEHIYIEAHTIRQFSGTCDNAGATTITLESALSSPVLGHTGVGGQIAPDLRVVCDAVTAGDTHADGSDSTVLTVASTTAFDIGANAANAEDDQIITFYGNQKAITGVKADNQKYITHAHIPASDIKVGLRASGTNIGTNAVVSRIISDTEFEVDVISDGSSSNVINFSDTIKIKFDNTVTQANSTKHVAGVLGIFGAEDNLTNRTSVLTSLKRSLDLWVSAGAQFSVGGITNNGTLPYLKITHNEPGPSAIAREVYGAIIKGNELFGSTRPSSAIADAASTNKFTNEAVTPIVLATFTDTILDSSGLTRAGGSTSFSNADVKYTRITNNGSTKAILYIHVGNSDLKGNPRLASRSTAIEATANLQEAYHGDTYIVDILLPGESKIYYDNKVDIIGDSGNTPILTEIDNIYGVSESATVNGSVEVFVASK